MRAAILATLSFSLLAALDHAHAQELLCDTYAGAKIVADDKRFLGNISSVYDPESILNKYGNYGSKYSPSSIWNEYGHYGGTYSGISPFNPYSTKPPQIVLNGKTIAHLSVSKTMHGAVSPYFLKKCKYN